MGEKLRVSPGAMRLAAMVLVKSEKMTASPRVAARTEITIWQDPTQAQASISAEWGWAGCMNNRETAAPASVKLGRSTPQ